MAGQYEINTSMYGFEEYTFKVTYITNSGKSEDIYYTVKAKTNEQARQKVSKMFLRERDELINDATR